MWPVLEMQLRVDDYVEFQRNFLRNHPIGMKAVERQRVRAVVGTVVGMLLGAEFCGGGALLRLGWGLPIVGITFAFAAVLCHKMPGFMLESYRRRWITANPTGASPVFHLWIDDWGISDESELRCTRYPWTAVRQVVETPTHFLVWISASSALVLPKRIGEPYVRALVDGVMAYSAQARSPWTPPNDVSGR
jgi:hypothetical protein